MAFFKKFRDAQRPCCAALVAAAGSSSRMGGVNKLLQPLDGIPVLARTLTALQMARRIDEIVVAAREEDFLEISQLCRTYGITKCTKVIRGGESRAHSVLLAALEAGEGMELLAVQDGARPLVTPELIDDVAEQAARCGAAAPAVAVKDTIKAVRDDGTVAETLDRAALRAVQTPQIFESALLKAALQAAVEGGIPITDDCSAVERLGKRVYLRGAAGQAGLSGGGGRGKPEDHHSGRPDFGGGYSAGQGGSDMTNLRIGHGYDVHRLTERRRLVLGGVEIPWDRGLLGHSDADVLTHAVMDALCGAAKLGDIGKLFPDSDPRYAGISSLELLRQVAALLQERGWAVVNIDATLIAQAPKVGPYRPEMEANLSAALGTDADRVNVKATTEEHLGFTGDGSGMAAHAVALLERLP